MNHLYTAAALLFGVIIISGSFLFIQIQPIKSAITSPPQKTTNTIERNRPEFTVRPGRAESARIFGDVQAPITIVEFSDYECSYCAKLHPTLERIVAEFGDQVRWEYRHLPLVIHINAREAALAAECVGDIAGNDAFWDFSTHLFKNQNTLSLSLYATQAEKYDISTPDLFACMESPEMAERLLADEQIALALGAAGTPFSIIEYANKSTRIVSGALPYDQWVGILIE